MAKRPCLELSRQAGGAAFALALRDAVATRLPRVDLPEILLEIASRAGFTVALTHVTERTKRITDLKLVLAEACNTGPQPSVHHDIPALRRRRRKIIDSLAEVITKPDSTITAEDIYHFVLVASSFGTVSMLDRHSQEFSIIIHPK
jgi:hypothetical protein